MRKTLLFVEDEALIAMLTTQELRSAGYNVIHVYNGKQAIEVIEKDSQPIHLVLMDIDLDGGADGVETAETLLAAKSFPIVFLSSHVEQSAVDKAKRIPFYGFVPKSVGAPILLASIEAAFRLYDTQAELRKSQEKLLYWNNLMEAIVRHDHSALAILDKNLTFLYVSDAYRDDPDLAGKTIVGQNLYEVYPQATSEWKLLVQRALQGEVINSGEDLLVRKNGNIEYIRWQCRPWYANPGKIGGIMMYTDYVSDVIQQREELRRKEADIKEAYHIAEMGRWEIAVGTHTQIWSDTIYDIFEIEKGRPETMFADYTAALHPEDRDWVLESHSAQAIATKEPLRIEHRLLMKDGRVKWIIETCRTEYNSKGDPVKLVGIVQENTKQKNHEEILQRLVAEKDTLLLELRHRIKNNLQVISSLLSLEMMKHPEPIVQEALGESITRIKSMSLIYEKLHRADNFIDIDLAWYLEELTRTLFTTYTRQNTVLRLVTRFEKTHINSKKAVPIGLIVNELITNCVKYAYPDSCAGEIRITLENYGANAALRIEDDGPGLPKDIEAADSGGTGLKLVYALAKQISGVCSITTRPGTMVAITFSCT
jgi:two-component sensor histidine kinase/PAS domain-containing protein